MSGFGLAGNCPYLEISVPFPRLWTDRQTDGRCFLARGGNIGLNLRVTQTRY